MNRLHFLAAVGDANSARTWSGIPFHLLQTAQRMGVLDHGLALCVDGAAWRTRRVLWNLARVLTAQRYGGYQFSVPFLEKLWARERGRLTGHAVLNCFPLYPPSLLDDQTTEKAFYIDMTLSQLFEEYGHRSIIGKRIAADCLKREREGYQAARLVLTHSQWAANSVIHDYGIPPEKVHAIIPGANIDAHLYERWDDAQPAAPLPVAGPGGRKLVFVGKYWHRKGLDRLIGGLRIARRRGSKTTLRVIGCPVESVPAWLRESDGVEWIGFVDKTKEPERFLDLLSECEVGCLLSRAEAGGMAQREYHALGLAVLSTDVGGAAEHAIPGASIIVRSDAGDEQIGELLLALDRDGDLFRRLRETAWKRRHDALWQASVSKIGALWTRPDTSRAAARVK